MINNIKKGNLTNIIMYCLGLFSTMPIVSIYVGGMDISLFTILLPIATFVLLISGKLKLSNNNAKKFFLLFLLGAFLSTLFGYFYFLNVNEYRDAALSYIPKLVIYLFLSLITFSSTASEEKYALVLKGLLMGAILNLVWASLDGIIYYLCGISINNTFFSRYIVANNIRYGMLSLILPSGIRAAGFNYDPAHIGFLAPFVLGYGLLQKRSWLIILAIVSLIMSQSVLGVAICFGMIAFYLLKTRNRKLILRVAAGSLFIVIACLTPTLNRYIEPLLDRVMSKFGDSSTESLRVIYSFRFIEAAFASPVSPLIGTGFGTASFPFEKAELIDSRFAFDPENTYVSYLFDIGFVGLILFIWCMLYLFKGATKLCTKRKLSEIMCCHIITNGVLVMAGSYLFYHYILYAPQMILVIFGIAWLDRCNKR